MKKLFEALLAIVLVSGVFITAITIRKNTGEENQKTLETPSSQSSSTEESEFYGDFSVRGESVDWVCDGNTPIVEPQGSTFVLKSIQPKQGEAIESNAPLRLGYSGEFHVTVNHCEIFSTLEEAGVDWADVPFQEESVKKRLDDPCFVPVDLTLENVNAANRAAIQYGFSASMFDLMGQNDFVPPNNTNPDYDSLADESVYGQFYFSDHADSEKDYYSFMLEPGKSLSVQLGFFVERKFVEEQDLYLKLGAIRNNLCGIALQPMKK